MTELDLLIWLHKISPTCPDSPGIQIQFENLDLAEHDELCRKEKQQLVQEIEQQAFQVVSIGIDFP